MLSSISHVDHVVSSQQWKGAKTFPYQYVEITALTSQGYCEVQ